MTCFPLVGSSSRPSGKYTADGNLIVQSLVKLCNTLERTRFHEQSSAFECCGVALVVVFGVAFGVALIVALVVALVCGARCGARCGTRIGARCGARCGAWCGAVLAFVMATLLTW